MRVHANLPLMRAAYQMRGTLLLAFMLLAVSCVVREAPVQQGAVLPELLPGAPLMSDAVALAVDPEESRLILRVYRAGPLARFGHNHVITGPVHGEIRAGSGVQDSAFHLEIPVETLTVDDPAARAAEGEPFAGVLSAEARAGTRRNLLGAEVLDAASHPRIIIDAMRIEGSRQSPEVTARVVLRGERRDVRFPAEVVEADGRFIVNAAFRILQSDFGMRRFSVLGGGLSVADEIDVRLRLVAAAE